MRKFWAFISLLLFIILTPLALYAFNLSRTLLNPELYKTTFEETDFYPRLGPLIADLFLASLTQEVGELPPQAEEEMERILAGAIPNTWLQEEMEKNVDIFFAWIDQGFTLPEISFDLRPVKAQLVEAMPRLAFVFFEARWNALEVCPTGTLPTFEDNCPSCRPSWLSAELFFASPAGSIIVETATEEFLAEIPNTLRMREIIVGESRGEEALKKLERAVEEFGEFRNSARNLRTAGFILPIISTFAFFALAALSATSLRSLLGWTGSGLLIAGLLALLPTLFVSAIAANYSQALSGALAEAGASFGGTELVRSLVDKILGAALSPIQTQSLVMAGVGLISVAGAVIVGARGLRTF